jgi:hypothetical protein
MRKVLLVTVALCAISTAAFADETLKYRMIAHGVSLQQMNVPDGNGHVIAVFQLAGLISMQDGTVGQANITGMLDYINGFGPYTSYVSLTFSDGSALYIREEGKSTREGDKGVLTGVDTIIGGKGRYAGAKGDGSSTGARVSHPLGPSVDSQLYVDATLNIKTGNVAGK